LQFFLLSGWQRARIPKAATNQLIWYTAAKRRKMRQTGYRYFAAESKTGHEKTTYG